MKKLFFSLFILYTFNDCGWKIVDPHPPQEIKQKIVVNHSGKKIIIATKNYVALNNASFEFGRDSASIDDTIFLAMKGQGVSDKIPFYHLGTCLTNSGCSKDTVAIQFLPDTMSCLLFSGIQLEKIKDIRFQESFVNVDSTGIYTLTYPDNSVYSTCPDWI